MLSLKGPFSIVVSIEITIPSYFVVHTLSTSTYVFRNYLLSQLITYVYRRQIVRSKLIQQYRISAKYNPLATDANHLDGL